MSYLPLGCFLHLGEDKGSDLARGVDLTVGGSHPGVNVIQFFSLSFSLRQDKQERLFLGSFLLG
jgi:hypothetical protein